MKSIISEMLQYDIGVDKLMDINESVDNNSLLGMKLDDISLIYSGFKEFIKDHYITSEEILDLMCRKVTESAKILDSLKESDVLVLAGSIPDVMPSSMYMDIMKHLEGRGINIVVDATRNLLTNVLAYKPFLIKPNNHELGEIFGVEITDKDDVIKYAKKLQEQGARNVLVSMAGDGAVLVTENGQEFKAKAPKGKLKNSVGAGDSMVAGFVYGYLKSNDYKQAFIYGVCTGSASAFSEELATKPEVEALIDKWDSASN